VPNILWRLLGNVTFVYRDCDKVGDGDEGSGGQRIDGSKVRWVYGRDGAQGLRLRVGCHPCGGRDPVLVSISWIASPFATLRFAMTNSRFLRLRRTGMTVR